ncbi:MAG: radical SAM protein [Desulfurococcales archaeon]|nr:radical SAM protein [Desulfurococcales archaeon]
MAVSKVLVVDGYNDEPGGLGVPPYIDVYPRYIAGAIWLHDRSARIDYVTVDELRRSPTLWFSRARGYDVVVFIAGVVVPGRYIGARPATAEELVEWVGAFEGPLKVLVGPAAKWGMGLEGGRPAYPPWQLKKAGFDVLVTGDVEEYFYDLARHGPEKASPYRVRSDYRLVDLVARLGARIVEQHPNYGRNLIAEIETYRGCARWVSGGCSFCVEPLRGRPIGRSPEGIVSEVEALYMAGVRNFRLGRQADILVYGSERLGADEWPVPSPVELRRLFHGIRSRAPGLEVLHIDNVNPGTLARYPREGLEALKVIVEYHTPGDVAAMGVETADERVASINNLNTSPEEALEAIRLVNKVGSARGYNGMPELLPGVNFVLGLPGETRETYEKNREFLEAILREGLLVRRVNVRKIMVIPLTRASKMGAGLDGKRLALARSFTRWVRDRFDREMLRRIAPRGTTLAKLWVEECHKGYCYARQVGSYPLMVLIPCSLEEGALLENVVVTGVHSGRSLEGLPVPISPESSLRALSRLLGRSRALEAKSGKPESWPLSRKGVKCL